MDTLLTVSELANLLKLSKSQIYAIKEKIGFYRIGGAIRFRREDVQLYLNACRENGGPRTATLPLRRQLKHIKI